MDRIGRTALQRDTGRLILTAELYVILTALLLSCAVLIFFNIFDVFYAGRSFVFAAVFIMFILGAAVFAPLLGKSVRHYIQDDILNVQYGVFYRYSVSVDFRKIIYISKIRGPFEKICGITLLVFYVPGGRVFLPCGDNEKTERYMKAWKQHIL